MSEAKGRPPEDWPTTLEDFHRWHAQQPEVFEFIFGVPKLMAPGSATHTLLKSRAGRLLGQALQGSGCEALIDGAVVEVAESSLIPDIVVTCEPIDFASPRIANPLIVVEVLSRSNEKDDLGRKLALYLQMPSIRHYLAISQERRLIIHHERRDDLGEGFFTTLFSGELLHLDPPGIALPLADLYDGVPQA